VAWIASRSEMRPSAPEAAMRLFTEVTVPSTTSVFVVTISDP